jgi:glucuronate isomerase
VARRCDAAFLAELVLSHRLGEEEAFEIAPLLANGLAKKAYNL